MAHIVGPALMPRWPDYSESEIDYTALPNLPIHPNHPQAIDRLEAMQDWQPQIATEELNDEPVSYSPAQGEILNSLFSQDTRIPSSSRVPSMVSTETVASTSQSPSHASVSSFNLEFSQGQGICPLATGQTKECVPEYCGIDAPCLSFVNQFPEIEESDLTPCVQRSFHQKSPSDSSNVQTSPIELENIPMIDATEAPTKSKREQKTANASRNAGSGTKPEESGRARGRQAHSLVERKYRENLNAKIEELHDALRKTRSPSAINTQFTRSAQSFSSANRARKGDILTDALNYIYQSQVDMRHMAEEIGRLKAHMAAAEQPPTKCDDCNLRKQVKTLRLLVDGSE